MHKNQMPILSIIIANYNYGRYLEEAINSVDAQCIRGKVELIICDAASSDNSVETIKKFAEGLPPNTSYEDWHSDHSSFAAPNPPLITWWCSEKDGGQSAAFNKGFAHANGEWLTWLNADDLLLPGTLMKFFELQRVNPDAEWITGNKVHFDSNTGRIISVHWGPHRQPPFLFRRRAFSAVFGPTTFIKKTLYKRIGPIDESLHYAMDTEYWARMTMAGVRQVRLNHLCWGFRVHEESKTEGVQSEAVRSKREEETRYWKKKLNYNFPVRMSNVWYFLWALWRVLDGSWIVRWLLKRQYEGCLLEDVNAR